MFFKSKGKRGRGYRKRIKTISGIDGSKFVLAAGDGYQGKGGGSHFKNEKIQK